ncbi:MAG: type 4a pilus biogenesis protein PilO [Candidatus Gorgyraea atricola]|nr:type 4a pilus biogenesis protein PilO [Candidatus Gorgyraea atricola]
MNVKLNLKDKKSLMHAGIFIAILLIVFQFIYFPKHRQVKKLEAEHKTVKKDIDELYSFIGGQENLKDNIVNMRREMSLLEGAFPFEKEVSNIIKQLNREAKRFKINVVSIKPKNLVMYKDEHGGEIKVSEYFCKCMPLTLKVQSRYQALGEFLMSLEESRLPLVSVERVSIVKSEPSSPNVDTEVELNAFMLGK